MATRAKRVRDEEQNIEGVERQDGCPKKRSRSENWSAKETLQMLKLRKAIVETSSAKGSDAWNQIAQQLADMNPESEVRSPKQVAQKWDTLVKIYVSVEEQRCETGKAYGEVIHERQKRCKAEYTHLWHELISQGNPGKRRAGKTPIQPKEAPATLATGVMITQAPAPSLSPGASQAVLMYVPKFGEIVKPFTEMLDTINRSVSSSAGRNKVVGQANQIIVTGSNWEPEDGQGLETTIFVRGLKKQQDETQAEVARATQSMADTMQSISKAAATSESFYLKVDQKDWSTVIQSLSAISQKYRAISVQGTQGIREKVGADVWIQNSQQQTISAAQSTGDRHINSIPRTLSSTSSCLETRNSSSTSSSTFAGLSDIVHLSPTSGGILRRDLEAANILSNLESQTSIYVF